MTNREVYKWYIGLLLQSNYRTTIFHGFKANIIINETVYGKVMRLSSFLQILSNYEK